jgi:hypothetical protein
MEAISRGKGEDMKKTLVKKPRTETPVDQGAQLEESLRKAAYFRWIERGAPEGDGLEDWYEVENRWRDNIVPANNN